MCSWHRGFLLPKEFGIHESGSTPPFFIGKPGCVRSNAWIWLFSSKLNTAALCGGSRYNPTTSRNFSSKRGSLLSLKVRIRCGFSPWARHTRLTKLCVVFRCRAIDRHDQWVASTGIVCVVASRTWLRSSACLSESLPPWFAPRGRSFSILDIPSFATRLRQRPTLFASVPSSAAIALFVIPSDAIRTIRARSRRRTEVLRAEAHFSSFLCSSFDRVISAATRIASPSTSRHEAG